MLDAYVDAFSRYLRGGDVGALADFCDDDAELAFLRVYRNGFLRTCTEALASSYPTVSRLVGEECFRTLALRYVELHPPCTASLAAYGESFPRFVEDEHDQHRLDYLPAFAMLDRAWTEVYFAEDAQAPDPNALTAMAGDAEAIPALRFSLAPTVRRLSLAFAALDAWARLRRGDLRQRVEVPRTAEHVLVWRSDGDVSYRLLSAAEHAFVALIAAGRPCGEAAEAALEVDPAFDVAATFASLLHERMLATHD